MTTLVRTQTLAALCVVTGCAMPTDGGIGSRQEGVQTAFYYTGMFDFVDSASDTVNPLVGNLLHYRSIKMGGEVLEVANCGVTFISPHFAITASHCVDQYDMVAGPLYAEGYFYVQQIDISAVDPAAPFDQDTVYTGSGYPDWEHDYSRPPGYERTWLLCRAKCGRPAEGLPSCFGSPQSDDIALIECPDRTAEDYATVTGNPGDVGEEVEVRWFHEFADLPSTPVFNERWYRYGDYRDFDGDTPHDDNFHYTHYHLYWPLIGDQNSGGENAEVIPGGLSGRTIATDLFGCHGTSGSGVFARGSTSVYGPVSTFVDPYENDLCDAEAAGINAVAPEKTQSVVDQVPEVMDDRNGDYTPSF